MIKFLGSQKDINTMQTIYSFGVMGDIIEPALIEKLVNDISKKIAEEWLKENQSKVFEKMDSQVILNLALAKSAAKVFDEIKK